MSSISRDKLGEYLSAYLDDELDDRERQAVERLLARDERVRRQYEELRQTAELVGELPRGAAPAGLAEAVQAAAERHGMVAEQAPSGSAAGSMWSRVRIPLALAAAFVLTVAGTWYVTQSISGPRQVAVAPGALRNDVGSGAAADGAGEAEEKVGAVRGKEEPAPTSTPPADASETASALRTAPAKSRAVGRDDYAYVQGEAQPSAPVEEVEKPEEAVEGGLAVPAERVRDVLASLTLDQKLHWGSSAEELAHHNFANEAYEIAVAVSGARDAEEVQRQVVQFAEANSAVNINTAASALPSFENQRVVVEGRKGVNFSEANQRQVLLRFPRSEVGKLVEVVQQGASGQERPVQMALGPVVANTAADTKMLTYQMQEPPGRLLAMGEVAGATGLEEKSARSELLIRGGARGTTARNLARRFDDLVGDVRAESEGDADRDSAGAGRAGRDRRGGSPARPGMAQPATAPVAAAKPERPDSGGFVTLVVKIIEQEDGAASDAE